MSDPIQRDMRTYTFISLCSLVGVVAIALMGGLYLKQGTKHPAKVTVSGSVHAGCYKWSDGTVTCVHGWQKLTDDMLYGCTVANADPATGECK